MNSINILLISFARNRCPTGNRFFRIRIQECNYLSSPRQFYTCTYNDITLLTCRPLWFLLLFSLLTAQVSSITLGLEYQSLPYSNLWEEVLVRFHSSPACITCNHKEAMSLMSSPACPVVSALNHINLMYVKVRMRIIHNMKNFPRFQPQFPILRISTAFMQFMRVTLQNIILGLFWVWNIAGKHKGQQMNRHDM